MISRLSNTMKLFLFLIFCVGAAASSNFYSGENSAIESSSNLILQKDSLVKKIMDELTGDSISIENFGKLRIIEKDGSIKKNITLKEIHSYWIIYEKEGSLHDFLIASISRIEFNDFKNKAIYFDKKGKPMIRLTL